MTIVRAVILSLSLLALAPGVSQAKGCLKGAAVGGVAGHLIGKHAVAGAAVGCAVAHHEAKVKARRDTQSPVPAANSPASSASATQANGR